MKTGNSTPTAAHVSFISSSGHLRRPRSFSCLVPCCVLYSEPCRPVISGLDVSVLCINGHVASLTLARTCHFAFLERTFTRSLILIAIELCNKNERKVWNVLNPTMLTCTTLGYILTFPGPIKYISCVFSNINVFANNF